MSIQTIRGGMWIPTSDIGDVTNNGTLIIDANDEKAAVIMQAPFTGTIAKVGWDVRTFTSNSTIDVRIETVDLTTGDPTGTLQTANANGSEAVTGTGWKLTTLTAGAVVTKGDLIAVVFAQPSSGAGSIVVNCGAALSSYPYVDLYTGSWAKTNRFAYVGLEYSDGSYYSTPLVTPTTTPTTVTWNNTSTPDERGLRFSLPFPARITGYWLECDLDGDTNVFLYDTDGVTALLSDSMDLNVRATNGFAKYTRLFNSNYTIRANVFYRLVVAPSSATSLSIYYRSATLNNQMDGYDGGQNFHYTTAKDPTGEASWTNTVNQKPVMGLICDGLDDGQTKRFY